jgi:hypothetical protein
VKGTGDQLVVVVVLPLDRGVNFGRRLAQASSAFLTAGLFVFSVAGGVELVEDDRLGRVTPWIFRQLR